MARSLSSPAAPLPEEKAPRSRVVVAEAGVPDVDLLGAGGDWEETLVITSQAAATPMDLPLEVAERVARLERRQLPVGDATFFVAPTCDVQASAARELIIRTLVAHLATAGSGQLTLVARDADGELRDRLLGLVGLLLGELGAEAVVIRLQFRDGERAAPPSSGVWPAVTHEATA
ncbi:MAG TPA: hypothetical protein VFV94_05705 [Polyangiaceae bacterium]|nr:hypothetical protein [Polyangiaceae bacterium]